MFFKSQEHMERFLNTLEDLNKTYNGILDNEYSAAVYILTADKEIWSKSKQYISHDGLKFDQMLEKEDFSSSYNRLVRLACNLFNGYMHIDPLDLIGLDEDNFKLAIAAIELRQYKTHAEDIAMSGRPATKERERITELRKQGMTHEAIARELNVSLSTVKRHLKSAGQN